MIENIIVLGAMDVATENCALVVNGIEDSAAIYIFLSSNVQLSPLIVSMFYIPILRGPERLSNMQLTPL